MPWTPDAPEPLDVVYERLRDFRAQYDRDENWIMGVFSPDDSRCLGGTGLHPRQGEGGLEIGYWIAADEVGRGYATEISAVLTRVGFERASASTGSRSASTRRTSSRSGSPRSSASPKEATLRRRLPRSRARSCAT